MKEATGGRTDGEEGPMRRKDRREGAYRKERWGRSGVEQKEKKEKNKIKIEIVAH